MVSLSEKIKQKASELGIDKIGFARAGALADRGSHFFEWLERGHHGEMGWLEREPEKRTDPRSIFPDARTVVSVAVNYYTPYIHSNDKGAGKISRYAWGDDYHDVVKEKLRALLDWIIAENPEATGKACV
ncbi:MAG TPA: QueG-associated DUF1730 domain-containing protein, partial [Pyrinomonadaceae bacterium]|nr:QueG-associated DUF1730 domain-containing protein [Pyrinomonadaceae bacterium]